MGLGDGLTKFDGIIHLPLSTKSDFKLKLIVWGNK